MSHDFYINMSYAITFGLIGIVCLWTWLDGRARQRELKALEATGMRRRSAQSTASVPSADGTPS